MCLIEFFNVLELYVVKTGLYKNFVSAEGIFMWKSLQTQGETILIGLGKNFILVTSYNNKNDTSVHKEGIYT